MTIAQLVKELESPAYKIVDKKVERIKKNLKVDYVDYLAKIEYCTKILAKSMYAEVNGKEIYKPNTPLRYALTISTYLQAYYNFELSNVFMEDFNLLEKNNLTPLLVKAIGDDVSRFNFVMDGMIADLDYANSLVPYLDTKIESMGVALSALSGVAKAVSENKEENDMEEEVKEVEQKNE